MRVHKIANFFTHIGQPTEILPYNLSIQEKHNLLLSIEPEDILYVQKWRTDFNCVEHLTRYRSKCKIIFDMDDTTGDKQALDLIELCDALVVGNHYLYDTHNTGQQPVFLVPSPVDLKEYPKFTTEGPLSISLAKCGIGPQIGPLDKLKEALCQLHRKYRCELVLAGFNDKADEIKVKEMFPFAQCHSLKTYDEYLRVTVPILQKTTVGILPFTKRDNGKSGHSALANLAMGVPTTSTVYAECGYIIEDGVNGLIVNNRDEWYSKIETLFNNPDLRMKFRQAGWDTIAARYDVPVIAQKLLECLKKI